MMRLYVSHQFLYASYISVENEKTITFNKKEKQKKNIQSSMALNDGYMSAAHFVCHNR